MIQYSDEISLPKCALDNEEALSGGKTAVARSNHLVPRLRMCGANPPLPHMLSWIALEKLYFVPHKAILIRCNVQRETLCVSNPAPVRLFTVHPRTAYIC
jgi:hypothetical protein